MAVCAPDFAFRNLLLQYIPRDGHMSESTYVCLFVAEMIEIEEINVGLPTIHAGVIREVSAHPGAQLGTVMIASDPRSRNLSLSIARVPLVRVRPLAQQADPLTSLSFQRAKGELRQGLGFRANATDANAQCGIDQQLDRGAVRLACRSGR